MCLCQVDCASVIALAQRDLQHLNTDKPVKLLLLSTMETQSLGTYSKPTVISSGERKG